MADEQACEMANPSRLCNLPYDIRQLIYDELFPSYSQLYLMASRKNLQWIRAPEDLPTEMLLVNRFLHQEVGEYMYNRYLFNIIGPIQDCLRLYPRFEEVMSKYANQPVRINAFGNGEHSDTCCISLQPGSKHLKVLNKRRRGKPSNVEELRNSMRSSDEGDALVAFHVWFRLAISQTRENWLRARYWILSVTALIISVYLTYARSSQ